MSALAAPVLAGGLAVIGLVAAGPGSAWLARADWPERSPAVSLVLWQALCLCAGLSLTGAALVLAIEPLGGKLPSGIVMLLRNTFHGRPLLGLGPWRTVLLIVAVVFATAMLVALIRCFVLTLLRRRSHRQLLDLLTATDATTGSRSQQPSMPTGVRVVDHRAPVAYGVPGWHTRLVLTAGLIELLTPPQLAAVVAHERAHLRSHHDLLLLPFQAWAVALGRLPGVDAARQAVVDLAEMQADDAAARQVGAHTVASALAAVALADRDVSDLAMPTGSPELGGTAIVRRVRRLREPKSLSAAAVIAVWLMAAAVLALPAAALFISWS